MTLFRAFLPRTLLGRTVLVLIVTVAATQVATQLVFLEFVTEQYTRSLIRVGSNNLAAVALALRSMDPARRAAFAAEIGTAQNLRLMPATPENAPPAQAVHELPDRLARIEARLGERLGPGVVVLLEADRQPPRVWTRLPVAGGDWWASFERTQFDRAFPLSATLLLALSLCLAVLVAWLTVRRINRPLRAVQRNILALSIGAELPHPGTNAGLQEINDLARAVERTSSALRTGEQERALLLAGISHDLRTPLSRVRLAIEMLGIGNLEEQEAMVGDLEEIDRIIDQFLDFARNPNAAAASPGDLSDVARECGQRARQHIAGLEMQLVEHLPIAVRRPSLDRMIANLLENAHRHGFAPILLQTTREGGWAVLSVLDRGPGIPPEEVPRLLQPFTRRDVSRTGPGGAGLGLAIVDRIARAHGGTLELLPRSGGGLQARVSLPLLVPEPPPLPPAELDQSREFPIPS